MSSEFVELSRRVGIILAESNHDASNSLLVNPSTIGYALLNKLKEYENSPSNLLEAEITVDMAQLRTCAPKKLIRAFETYMRRTKPDDVAIEVNSPQPSQEDIGWCLYYLICLILAAVALLGVYYIAGAAHL